MKLGQIANAFEALKKISTAETPTKVSLQIKRNISKLSSANEVFHEKRGELFKRLGERKGDRISILPENLAVYLEEMAKLENEEADIEYEQINISLVDDTVKISADTLMAIDWMSDE